MKKALGSRGRAKRFARTSWHDVGPIGPVTSRKMFGGFGIFHDGAMFGIVSKTSLYFKVNDETLDAYKKARSKQHKPMPYYSVPSTVLARTSSLHKWARTAIDVAHAPGAKKTTKRK